MNYSGEAAAQKIVALTEQIRERVERTILGQTETIRYLTGAFLIGGHVLLEGPPGIAKTLLARTFASVLGLSFKRVQFTPDLMPSDVTGVNVFEPRSGSFRFAPGPLFADIVLADEINRTPPKTQSALLEAMEEHVITIDGESHPLGALFFVVATQNPIEHEGTFPLPEAQLDRFLFKLTMKYPALDLENAMVQKYSGREELVGPSGSEPPPSFPIQALLEARQAVRSITLAPALSDYIVRLVTATREHGDVALGVSPRGALNLALATKLHAALCGRGYAIPDDVKEVAFAVMNHRLIFKPEVYDAGRDPGALIKEIFVRTPVPSEIR